MEGQKGFTLAEVMVAAGMVGLVALAANYGLEMMSKMKRTSEAKAAQSTLVNEIGRQLTSVGKKIVWTNFDFNRSFYVNNSATSVMKVNWTFADIPTASSVSDIQFQTKVKGLSVTTVRDSFTLEYVNDDGSDSGLIASRCVPKGSYNAKMSATNALSLAYGPFVFKDNKGIFRIRCCRINGPGLCSGDTIDESGDSWRVNTFMIRRNAMRTIPGESDARYILGAGFAFYFNQNTEPYSYTNYVFSIRNGCPNQVQDCDKVIPPLIKQYRGDVNSTGVHDSGVLIIK